MILKKYVVSQDKTPQKRLSWKISVTYLVFGTASILTLVFASNCGKNCFKFRYFPWTITALICSAMAKTSKKTTKDVALGNGNVRRNKKLQKKKQLIDRTGYNRGIEGANNSCYLDAFLFSIFYATSAFEKLLEPRDTDTDIARKTRKTMKESILDPLRKQYFCSSEQAMALRHLLKSHNPKIMGSFQAIEDVVYLLFENVLNERKFIQYEDASGFMHVMMADTNSQNLVAETQECLESSMKQYGDMKLGAVPCPGFIVSLPYHKNRLFNFQAIVPSLNLNIIDLIALVKCDKCNETSMWESVDIFDGKRKYSCSSCITSETTETMKFVDRTKMKLSAVMCFKGAHFTAFARDFLSDVDDNAWFYFDSMVGGTSQVKDVSKFLNPWTENWKQAVTSEKVPHEIRAFFRNAHTCIYEPVFYQSKRHSLITNETNREKDHGIFCRVNHWFQNKLGRRR